MSDLNEIERGQICRTATECLSSTSSLSIFAGLLKKIIHYKAWERRHIVTADGMPRNGVSGGIVELSSLRELITEKPLRGWGEDPKKVEAVIKDDPEALAMFREAMNGTLAEHRAPTREERESKGSATTFSDDRGNDYWQARIQRDCPEELQAIKSGEKKIIDVRRERGWVSKSKRVTLTGDPAEDRQRLIDAWGEEYVGRLFKHDGETSM